MLESKIKGDHVEQATKKLDLCSKVDCSHDLYGIFHKKSFDIYSFADDLTKLFNSLCETPMPES